MNRPTNTKPFNEMTQTEIKIYLDNVDRYIKYLEEKTSKADWQLDFIKSEFEIFSKKLQRLIGS